MTKTERQHQEWQALLAKAYAAADTAARAAFPTPMIVGTPRDPVASLLGEPDGGLDPEEPLYFVSEGACGFAWLNFRAKATDGRRFLNWLQAKVASKYPAATALRQYGDSWRSTSEVNPPKKDDYYGGVTVWVGGYGQSVARKEAFGRALASVVNGEVDGLTVYCGSRLD